MKINELRKLLKDKRVIEEIHKHLLFPVMQNLDGVHPRDELRLDC